ncbi:uncharacterized protein B0H64DRAFT_440167 [Chaetomium fimeti]|uniref:AAA+ ATPase domain-containing protein n=1 Tax=Chaetomium fimeti TaxID=1854472 RepID=A0AAE0HHJ4_9PEZI|nr:hypothetical protein B0H64DRAFT_440167 [Chaetomium fimeti]
MSVPDYETALPDIFSEGSIDDAPGSTPGIKGTDPNLKGNTHDKDVGAKMKSSAKGFADIIEYQKSNPDGGIDIQILQTSQYIPQGPKTKRKEKDYDSYAIVLRRTISQDLESKPRLVRVEIEIQSPALCAALRSIVCSTYEGTNFDTVPIQISSPFYELFFYHQDIKTRAEDKSIDSDLRRELLLLAGFITKNGLLSSIIQDHARYTEKGQVPGDMIWTLYPPNSLVVFNGNFVKECWVVRSVRRVVDNFGIDWWQVSGFRLGCNGSTPGLVRQNIMVARVTIRLYNISELRLVPTQYFRDWGKLEETFKARAELVTRVLGDTLCEYRAQTYNGTAWEGISAQETHDEAQPPPWGMKVKQIDERVLVDIKGFTNDQVNVTAELVDLRVRDGHRLETGQNASPGRGLVPSYRPAKSRCSDPQCQREECKVSAEGGLEHTPNFDIHKILEPRPFAHDTEVPPDDEIDYYPKDLDGLAKTVESVLGVPRKQLMLLFPALVPAFGLKSKRWRWVLADRLVEVAWSKKAFESLRLRLSTKQLIQCLVEGHKDSVNTGFDDVVAGKGQGLIFLLHGDVGLGKTLTAEGISDHLKRPLYSISGGELSTDVDRAEKRLDRVFDLTKRWNAVALLDEADVLLCKRNSSEMDRNAMVGGKYLFLRKLEYFQGVLFLTTNRKQDLDEAFKSRIHVTISYPALDAAARSAIWRDLVNKNAQAGVNVDASWTTEDELYDALGELNFNGRTIKNILRTAAAYSYGDRKPLNARHVLTIVQTELSELSDDSLVVPENSGAVDDGRERQERGHVKRALEELEQLVQSREKASNMAG